MKILAIIITLIVLQSCMTEGPLKQELHTFNPTNLNDGWLIATPEEAGIDLAKLSNIYHDFHNREDLWMVRSLSVFKSGKIVAESYTKNNSDLTTPRAFWSCTKQIIGILAGIAIDKGIIESIDDPISKYLPDLIKKYPDKANITIENLLTMQSGLNFKNYGMGGDDSQILQENPDSFVEYSLAKDFESTPGLEFTYKDSDPTILAAVIQNQVGKPLDEWADEVLFSKIGFQNWEWRRYKDGYTIGSFGIIATPREMAKFTQLALNGGKWGNAQIVNKEYIEKMVSAVVKAGDKHFGYLWWSYPEHGTYFMSGNGRQLFFVFPEEELIVAITSDPKNQGNAQLSTPDGRKIAQAVQSACIKSR